MADIIQQRRDTAARWAQYNPILLEGEVGYVTDNPNQYKIGNGRDKWNDLPLRGYTGTITQDTGDDENAVMSQKAVSAKLSELGSKVVKLKSIFYVDKIVNKLGNEAGYENGYSTPYILIDRNYDIEVEGYAMASTTSTKISPLNFYDKDLNFVGWVDNSNGGKDDTTGIKSFTLSKTLIPQNAVYMRVSMTTSNVKNPRLINGVITFDRIINAITTKVELNSELNRQLQEDMQKIEESIESVMLSIDSPTSAYTVLDGFSVGDTYRLKVKTTKVGTVRATLNTNASTTTQTTVILDDVYCNAEGVTVEADFVYNGEKYIRITSSTNDITLIDSFKVLVGVQSLARLTKKVDAINKEKLSMGDLFCVNDVVVNKLGNEVKYVGGKCTSFIQIDKEANIEVIGFAMASTTSTKMSVLNFYDKDLNFIAWVDNSNGGQDDTTGIKSVVIEKKLIPENAVYVRASMTTQNNGASYLLSNGEIDYNRLHSHNEVLHKQTQVSNKDIAQRLSKIEVDTKEIDGVKLFAEKYDTYITKREQYLRQLYKFDNKGVWYGVRYNIDANDMINVSDISSENDMSICDALPIQNKMRRCVVKDGVLQYYLNADNSNLKEDGTVAVLDGSDGNVMVEIPEFFYKVELVESSVSRTVIDYKISENGIDGFNFSPKHYVGAYYATLNREDNILATVCTTIFNITTENLKTEGENSYIEGSAFSLGNNPICERIGFTENAKKFRGGHPDNSYLYNNPNGGTNRGDYWDNATDKNSNEFCLNKLGVGVAQVMRSECRNQSRMNIGETMYLYDTQRALWILSTIEFKTANIQDAINANNPRSGGLGWGATVYPNYDAYEAFFSYRGTACIPNGVTNTLGNKSGQIYYRMHNVPVAFSGSLSSPSFDRYANVLIPVMSYRGVENFYGHLYSCADQIAVSCANIGGENREVKYWYQRNPFKCSTDVSGYEYLGKFTFEASIKCITRVLGGFDGHILPTLTNGTGYTKGYYDCSELGYSNDGRLQAISYNGRLVSKTLVGRNFIVSFWKDDERANRASESTRQCQFII